MICKNTITVDMIHQPMAVGNTTRGHELYLLDVGPTRPQRAFAPEDREESEETAVDTFGG
jgi:hypothetical protein